MGDQARYSSQRRSTDPYRTHRHHSHHDYDDHHDHHRHHQHTQPRYAPTPDYSRRRHTEPSSSDARLTRVHSRPEDYKNKPRPDKLFSYICFDDQGHPRECDEVKKPQSKQNEKSPESQSKAPERKCKGEHIETKAPLHRVDSYSSNEWARTDDSGDEADSEDELTLPSMYQHDIAQKDDEWSSARKPQPRSPERAQRTDKAARTDGHQEQHRRNSPSPSTTHRRPSASPSSSSSSRRASPTSAPSYPHGNAPIEGEEQSSSPNAQILIAKVAEHLQAHKDAYGHGGTKQLVNELLGEVVRKVADGGLDTKLMKDVVREVQHVL